jgi:hypothetical protein
VPPRRRSGATADPRQASQRQGQGLRHLGQQAVRRRPRPLGRAGLTDPRVTHLWDGPDVSGGWLAGNVDGYVGSDWDTYLLFGPDATWTAKPGPLLASGSPVDAELDRLEHAIGPLLS